MISVRGTNVNDVYFGIGEYLLISTTLSALLKVRGEDGRDELVRWLFGAGTDGLDNVLDIVGVSSAGDAKVGRKSSCRWLVDNFVDSPSRIQYKVLVDR
jgi:hypothetical protein